MFDHDLAMRKRYAIKPDFACRLRGRHGLRSAHVSVQKFVDGLELRQWRDLALCSRADCPLVRFIHRRLGVLSTFFPGSQAATDWMVRHSSISTGDR